MNLNEVRIRIIEEASHTFSNKKLTLFQEINVEFHIKKNTNKILFLKKHYLWTSQRDGIDHVSVV